MCDLFLSADIGVWGFGEKGMMGINGWINGISGRNTPLANPGNSFTFSPSDIMLLRSGSVVI